MVRRDVIYSCVSGSRIQRIRQPCTPSPCTSSCFSSFLLPASKRTLRVAQFDNVMYGGGTGGGVLAAKLQAKGSALLISDMSISFPLDRTFASLQGKLDLTFAKRSILPNSNADGRPFGRWTDPNGASRSPPPTPPRQCANANGRRYRTRFCYYYRRASIQLPHVRRRRLVSLRKTALPPRSRPASKNENTFASARSRRSHRRSCFILRNTLHTEIRR